jgi:hypothetical protein
MNRILVLIAVVIAGLSETFAQSKSFQALETKFSSDEDVSTFSTSGFFARSILWLAGEQEFKKVIKEVKNIRLITIPKSAFAEHGVSVNGFKKAVGNDSYEEVATVREEREEVTIYVQSHENSSFNSYFILIDNPEEVVAVEIKGYIDVSLLNNQQRNLSFKP